MFWIFLLLKDLIRIIIELFIYLTLIIGKSPLFLKHCGKGRIKTRILPDLKL